MPKYEKWAEQDKMRESTQEYLTRLETKSSEKFNECRMEAKTNYLNHVKEYYKAKGVFESINLTPEHYNPDVQRFTINFEGFPPVSFEVARGNEAAGFLESWNRISKTPIYNIDNAGNVVLEKLEFKTPDGKSYAYDSKAPTSPLPPSQNYERQLADAIRNATRTLEEENRQKSVPTDTYNVDIDIPVTNAVNDKTFAVIIANENYRRESRVEYAHNDGSIFRQYCVKTLGIPELNIHYVSDATFNDLKAELNWVNKIAGAYKEEATIIFYYAGHGIPDEQTKTAYLLPVDGYSSDVTTGYKIDDLYKQLGDMPVKSVFVFMDACFSGSQRDEPMLASARGVRIKTELNTPTGNTVAFSAAQEGETAYPYREKKHGMFTFFLLKKLKENKGDVNLKELSDYITTHVKQQSIRINGKSQTPTVRASQALESKWTEMKLK
jgi:hypothetical protein